VERRAEGVELRAGPDRRLLARGIGLDEPLQSIAGQQGVAGRAERDE
jgi:hypothetical protein